jgi:phosphate transport system permease protein
VRSREILTAFDDGRAITSLAMVFGDVSLAVGDEEGGVSIWSPVRPDEQARPLLTLSHRLSPHSGAVRELLASACDKSLLSFDAEGAVHLQHTTSERLLLSLGESGGRVMHVGRAPRGDAVIGLDAVGQLTVWRVHAPHPEVSWRTLLGRTQYESYDRPSFTWQTTGTEDSEPKFSLVPLLFGTLKGTFYAMLLACPLALAGAAYTSHFTTPAFKQTIKPTVEIMAAVPSVVIGFLAALWLAPFLERWVLAAFACVVTVPLAFLCFLAVWQGARESNWAKRVEGGYEFLVLLPVLAAGVGLAALLTGPLEQGLFDGDFRRWLNESAGMRYDQRNSILIAFGLGFAVIPIVFSIAEDSLSSVPHSLVAASMALGGSRWQTLWRVVLPSASPGIFAGVMIGFGRAVGETMIVLMATGNTPILDVSPFNGMRTLSANIAVEIPEAPVDGTLYRVLFLCAVLLFLLTFALNTAADLVRQRLRRRFGRL